MAATAVGVPPTAKIAETSDTLEIYFHLKSMVLSNAKLLYGASKSSHARTYDIVTSSRVRPGPRTEYKASLVAYDETYRAPGKADVDSKTLNKSAVKSSVNAAVEDLLKKLQEEVWSKLE